MRPVDQNLRVVIERDVRIFARQHQELIATEWRSHLRTHYEDNIYRWSSETTRKFEEFMRTARAEITMKTEQYCDDFLLILRENARAADQQLVTNILDVFK